MPSILMERAQRNKPDFALMVILVLIIGFGLAILFSASYYRAEVLRQNPYYFFQRQVIWIVIGAFCAWIASQVSLDWVRNIISLLIFVTLLLIFLTFVPGIGGEILGARRWLNIFGYSFQPSELAKLTLIIYLAHILDKKRERINDLLNGVLPPLIVVGLITLLVYLQNDFSTAMFIVFMSLLLFFISGMHIRYFVGFGIMALPLGGILLLTREHRVRRIITLLEPGIDPTGSSYQILAAHAAMRQGGFWGMGLGNGVRKLGALPEANSDFVLAVLAEEVGFLGILAVLGLFMCFAFRGFQIALMAEGSFESRLAFGLTCGILFQVLINMAVVVGILPVTGIPLPFFSSGGSSLLITMISCGLLLNLSHRHGRNI